MPTTIIESDAFPATLTAPQATEPASAPGLISQFLQGIANRSRYLYNRVNQLTATGGTFNLAAPLKFLGSSTFLDGLVVNNNSTLGGALTVSGGVAVTGASTFANQVAVGGQLAVGANVAVAGFVKAQLRVQFGGRSGSVYSFNTDDHEYVYNTLGVTAGTKWRITDAIVNRPITFRNFDSANLIDVQDPLGNVLISIKRATGTGFYGATIMCAGPGSYVMIDFDINP